jgi:hypothetical protein
MLQPPVKILHLLPHKKIVINILQDVHIIPPNVILTKIALPTLYQGLEQPFV